VADRLPSIRIALIYVAPSHPAMDDVKRLSEIASLIGEDTLESVTEMRLAGLRPYGESERLTATTGICKLVGQRLAHAARPDPPPMAASTQSSCVLVEIAGRHPRDELAPPGLRRTRLTKGIALASAAPRRRVPAKRRTS
jgi:hypothetical protein